MTVKGVDRVYLSVGQGRVIFARERRVGIFRCRRLTVFFLRLDEAGRFVEVRVVSFYWARRNFNCALKDFRGPFPFNVFTRWDGGATVIAFRVLRDQESGFFFSWRGRVVGKCLFSLWR